VDRSLIVREFSRVSSNWRSQQVAEEYLEQFKVPVLSDIDTRALCGICGPRRDAWRGFDY